MSFWGWQFITATCGGFMFMDNLPFCCVHMLVYINDYILICQYKRNVDRYCTVTNTYTSTSLPYQCACSWTGCTGLLAVVAGTNVQSSVCSLHCLCWDSFQALLHSPASNQAASTCQLHTALPECALHEPVTWMMDTLISWDKTVKLISHLWNEIQGLILVTILTVLKNTVPHGWAVVEPKVSLLTTHH